MCDLFFGSVCYAYTQRFPIRIRVDDGVINWAVVSVRWFFFSPSDYVEHGSSCGLDVLFHFLSMWPIRTLPDSLEMRPQSIAHFQCMFMACFSIICEGNNRNLDVAKSMNRSAFATQHAN